MSLLGLQLGEVIIINSGGFVWRWNEHPDRTTMSDRDRRLEGATGLKIHEPADVHALARFMGEVMRALGQPFALQFTNVYDEEGSRVETARDIFLAWRDHDRFWNRPEHGDDEVEPEIPEVEWNPLTYYEAHFAVVAAPQK